MGGVRIGLLLSASLMLLVVDAGENSFRLLPRPTDPCDWKTEGRTPKKRYVFHEDPVSWFEALATCEAGGGTLAFPATCWIKKELRAIVNKSKESWRLTGELHGGFFRPDYFVTVFGSPLFDVGHKQWEPREENPEVCGTYNHDILLYDAKCTDRRSFICEYLVAKEKKVNITAAPLIVQTRPIEKFKPSRADPPTDPEWKALVQQGRMHWYKVFETRTRWSMAKRTCEKEGGHLLILNHDLEARVLRGHVRGHSHNASEHFYVGLHNGNNRFITLAGNAVLVGWEWEQPDDETCLAVSDRMDLRKVPCWEELSFICEMTLMDPE